MMPECLKITPPGCLRHVVPWCLLVRLNHLLPTCWASMVTWKLYGDQDSWWPKRMCFTAVPCRYDYCGKFQPEEEDQVVSPDVWVRFG